MHGNSPTPDLPHGTARHLTRALRDHAAAVAPATVATARRISETPAPTGDEGERAALVAALFRDAGIEDVQMDPDWNVVARIRGSGPEGGPAVLLAAHTDTVFPPGTDLTTREEPGRVYGPGIGDNSLGVAAVLAVPGLLGAAGIALPVDLLLTGNVGEEGLGNLRGMRAVHDAHPEIGAAVAVEGHNLGRVTHVAVGSRRMRVTVTGPGGHSWGDFGRPNAIQGAADIIHEMGRIPLSSSPKATLSVGLIEGGISVNTIPPSCTFVIDIRSSGDVALARVVERVGRVLEVPRAGLTVEAEVLGDRPAGNVAADSPVVRLALETLEAMGIQATGDASSTDANIPISRGIPSICIGLTQGGNVHREDEYILTEPVADGLTQLAALTALLGEALASGKLA